MLVDIDNDYTAPGWMLQYIRTGVRSGVFDRLDLAAFVSFATQDTSNILSVLQDEDFFSHGWVPGFGPVGAPSPPIPQRSSRHEQQIITLPNTAWRMHK